jgi:hypothetical protein
VGKLRDLMIKRGRVGEDRQLEMLPMARERGTKEKARDTGEDGACD